MAETLSPELLKILQGLGQTGGYADPASGMFYQGTFSGQGGGESPGYLTGYTASGGPTDVETARADTFGLDGNKTGNISAYDPKGLMQAEDWMGVLGVLGATLGGGFLANGLGLQGAATGGLGGPGSAGWGMDLGMGSGAASSGAVGPGMAGWGADLGVTSGGVGGGMGTTLTGSAGGALSAGAGGATPGLLDGLKNLLPAGAKDWIGPAATIAGGLLGAKGNEQSSTSTKALDPRLDPLVYGQGGLSSKIQDLLNKQTSKSGLLAKYWS